MAADLASFLINTEKDHRRDETYKNQVLSGSKTFAPK